MKKVFAFICAVILFLSLGTYIDGLNLESLPTVELELSVIGFDEYASEASDYASDVISIYEGSYNDAQIAFDEIEQGLTNYVNKVSIEGNNWYIAANAYRNYLSSQSEVISNNFITLSNYYDELSTWHTGLSSYADYLINSNNQTYWRIYLCMQLRMMNQYLYFHI